MKHRPTSRKITVVLSGGVSESDARRGWLGVAPQATPKPYGPIGLLQHPGELLESVA